MTAIARFEFEGRPLRVVDVDGQPYWHAPDVCRALGLKNVTMALRGLKSSEKALISAEGFDPGRPDHVQELNMVNEPGLWRLIFRSRVAAAERLQDFVYHEVLPTIRRTGGYGTGNVDIPTLRILIAQEARPIVEGVVRAIAAETVQADFAILRREIRTLEGWTLDDWCRRKRTTLAAKQARSIGSALSAICRGAGLPMGRQASEYRRGTPPRTYPRTVLELHFARLVDRHAPSPQLALLAAAPAPPQIPA